ncbi:hypothetical protein [Paraburkholderia nemoris]|uniref:hypothetical protein n=1 Tax=Paraburkholderia nemoris TaxID=2793076 RepID=UPI001B06531F|nr:hypothetical protein [Paraburkholderia nemoris]CAE6792983.1 hypothetical protein LMG22931_05043 [Paraburkholderia nemoris]
MTIKVSRITAYLALLGAPSVCRADVGDLGGIAGFAAAVFGIGWLLCCVVLFFRLRRLRLTWRIAISALTLISPGLIVCAAIAMWAVFGQRGDASSDLTQTPVTLAGAIFPAGSRIEYEQTGTGHWTRKPVQAQSDLPVKLGPLQIVELALDEGAENQVKVTLAQDQVIDGWPCGAQFKLWTTLDLASQSPRLLYCWLGSRRALGAVSWPPGANVSRQTGDWSLYWQSQAADAHAPGAREHVFGFPVQMMMATYSPTLDLKEWSGTAHGEDLHVGAYTFFGADFTDISWSPDGAIRIKGSGKNDETGGAIDCLTLRGKVAQPCGKEDANVAAAASTPRSAPVVH